MCFIIADRLFYTYLEHTLLFQFVEGNKLDVWVPGIETHHSSSGYIAVQI